LAKLLQIRTEDGDVFIAARTPEDAVSAVGVRENALAKVDESLDDALVLVTRIARSFQRALADVDVESAEIELGLQFTGKGRLYVVESELQAAMTVRLTLRPGDASTAS
jgi:hypothetical protein